MGFGLDEIADLLAFDLLGVLAVHVFPRQFEQRLVGALELTLQDLRKNHLNTGILELLNEVIVQQTALDPVDRLPALVG